MKPRHVATCEACGQAFMAKRVDARLCSPRCRKAASRAAPIALLVPYGRQRSLRLELPRPVARWLRDQLSTALQC